MGSSDEALLAGLAAGDREASAAFVRRFQRRAYGLARTIVGDSGTAEDVAQEPFVRAWRYAGSYDARRGTVLTWLLTIVRNVAVDRRRVRPAEPLDPDLLASKLQLADNRDPGEEHAALLERDQLREAPATLPEEQRRGLVLAAYFGRTAGEIAHDEGLPLGTAKTRIRTAMLRLRDWLEVADEH
ncbi:MAG TPA: sigma-70 family RNA polymerase sigma factor [Gaiellaceae bacterium]|nr:sigma-70 family RNA polymerase sigma factor [Gaiellaceae bacterium]